MLSGFLDEAKQLLASTSNPKKLLQASDYHALQLACWNHHFPVISWLYDEVEKLGFARDLFSRKCNVFPCAISSRDLKVAQYLYEKADALGLARDVLKSDDYGAFHSACAQSDLPMARWLYEKAENFGVSAAMLRSANYDSFKQLRGNGSDEAMFWYGAVCKDPNFSIVHRSSFDCISGTQYAFNIFGEKEARINLPTEGVIDHEVRCFVNVATKLKLLKDVFPGLDVATMLGVELTKSRTTKVDWAKLFEQNDSVSYVDIQQIIDSVNEISSYVGRYVLKINGTITGLNPLREIDTIADVRDKVAVQMLEGRTLPQLKKMSELWHRHRSALLKAGNKDTLRDFAEIGAWYQVTKEKEVAVTAPGLEHYQVVNLTDSFELQEEGGTQEGQLNHCVSGYVENCKMGYQVFSIRKKEDGEYRRKTTVGCNIEDGKLVLDQNLGYSNRSATKEEESVANWFIDGVNKRTIPADLGHVGEIPAESLHSPLESALGMEIKDMTPERLNNNFRKIATLNKSDQGYPFGRNHRRSTLQEYAAVVMGRGENQEASRAF